MLQRSRSLRAAVLCMYEGFLDAATVGHHDEALCCVRPLSPPKRDQTTHQQGSDAQAVRQVAARQKGTQPLAAWSCAHRPESLGHDARPGRGALQGRLTSFCFNMSGLSEEAATVEHCDLSCVVSCPCCMELKVSMRPSMGRQCPSVQGVTLPRPKLVDTLADLTVCPEYVSEIHLHADGKLPRTLAKMCRPRLIALSHRPAVACLHGI